MEKIQRINYQGTEILFQTFKDETDPQVIMDRLNQTKQMIMIEQPKSVLLLTDVSNCYYNTELISNMKKFSKSITPYVKASAMVGIVGLYRMFFKALIKFTGRDINAMKNLEEAKAWLLSQA